MRLGNAGAIIEFDERDRSASLFVPPQHLFMNAFKRLFAPRHVIRLNKNLLQIRSACLISDKRSDRKKDHDHEIKTELIRFQNRRAVHFMSYDMAHL